MRGFQILSLILCLWLAPLWGQSAQASSPGIFRQPGKYNVVGILVRRQSNLFIVIFDKSRDRISLKVILPTNKSARKRILFDTVSLINNRVEAVGHIPKSIRLGRGSIRLEKIRPTVPDYLKPSTGDGLWPLKGS